VDFGVPGHQPNLRAVLPPHGRLAGPADPKAAEAVHDKVGSTRSGGDMQEDLTVAE